MATGQGNLEITSWARWPVNKPGQGIAVAPAGEVYVAAGSYIVVYDSARTPSVFAGQSKLERFVEGHRLNEAGFGTLGGLRFIEDLLHFCDRKSHIIGYIENDNVVKYAGTGDEGRRDGPRLQATFSYPTDIISYRGKILISDYDSKYIRIINEAGRVSSITSDGSPFAFCAVGDDEALFVSCHMHNYIREIDLDKRATRVIAGTGNEGSLNGPVEAATFYRPRGMVCAGDDNSLYVIDCLNHRIRQVTTEIMPAAAEEEDSVTKFNPLPYQPTLKVTPVPNSVGWKYVSNLPGTLNSPEVSYPYFLVLSPEGELIWTDEQNCRLASIKNFATPVSSSPTLAKMTIKHFVAFSVLFDNANDASSSSAASVGSPLTLTHRASGNKLRLEPELINLALDDFSDSRLALLEESDLPFETVQLFVKLMYGDTEVLTSPSSESKCMDCIRLLILLRNLKIDVSDPLYAFITALYLGSLDALDLPTLIKVTIFIVMNSHASPELLYATDAIKKAQYNFKKWPGKPGTTPLSDPWKTLTGTAYAHLLESQFAAATSGLDESQALIQAAEIVESLGLKVLAHDFFVQSSQRYIFPFGKLQSRLQTMAEELRFKDVKDPLAEPNSLAIGISGFDKEVVVRDWIVWSRWKYLRRALGAGGAEALGHRLELPSYFPTTLLLPLLQFIYTGGTTLTHPMSDSDCLFIMINGAEFDLFEPNEYHGLATPEGDATKCVEDVSAIRGPKSTAPLAKPGFTNFVGHCRSRLLRGLTVDNCLPSLEYRLVCGSRHQVSMAVSFIEREWNNIKTLPDVTLRTYIDALSDHTRQILEEHGCKL